MVRKQCCRLPAQDASCCVVASTKSLGRVGDRVQSATSEDTKARSNQGVFILALAFTRTTRDLLPVVVLSIGLSCVAAFGAAASGSVGISRSTFAPDAWVQLCAAATFLAPFLAPPRICKSKRGSGDVPARTPRSRVAYLLWLAGQTLALVAIPTGSLWVGMIATMVIAPPSWPALVAGATVSLATALAIALARKSLSRPAAIALMGGWLLLGAPGASAALPKAPPWCFLTFPVSLALLTTDELSRFAVFFRALGSVALFDVGLLAVLFAFELRRDR